MKSKVAILECRGYDMHAVSGAVARGIGLLGGAGVFASPGERILLKPNLLAAEPPERCCTTHPSVMKAAASVFLEAGAVVSYGDSPALIGTEPAVQKSGMAAAASEMGIKLADFTAGRDVVFREGNQNRVFTIANGALDCDGIISLPKFKTHGFARMTGCVKNQFGCIPGRLKAEFHVRLPNVNDFCRMLCDLNLLLKPRLYIMDAVTAMEGNGPRMGSPKQMNMLLFSTDPVALDAVLCRIIGLDPAYVPTMVCGMESGLGTWRKEDIEILGDGMDRFMCPDFNVRRKPVKPYNVNSAVRFIQNMLVPKPYIKREKCIKCGTCAAACPVSPKALDWHSGDRSGPPSYTYERCIRCYCCQELCPEGAIHLSRPMMGKFLTRGDR